MDRLVGERSLRNKVGPIEFLREHKEFNFNDIADELAERLKGCPFCGSQPTFNYNVDYQYYSISCYGDCYYESDEPNVRVSITSGTFGLEALIETWQKRANEK